MKLAIGTVQFGAPYGVANTTGQVGRDSVSAILRHARLACVDTLDTAIAYGESEQCLGEVGVEGWRIVSKLPEVPDTCANVAAWVKGQIQGSLLRLKVSHLTGVLLHCPNQLLSKKGEILWTALQNLKCDGVVEKVGFSISTPSELDVLWPSFRPDLVQAPFNILDRRLSTSGWLHRMDEASVEVHVRSVFLQGLLLMQKKNRPKKFDRWSVLWMAWDTWLHEQGVTALQGCLAFAMAEPYLDKVIVGVDTLRQLKEILASIEGGMCVQFPERFEIGDIDLINPSHWRSL